MRTGCYQQKSLRLLVQVFLAYPHLSSLNLPFIPVTFPASPLALKVVQNACQVHGRILRTALTRAVSHHRSDLSRIPISINGWLLWLLLLRLLLVLLRLHRPLLLLLLLMLHHLLMLLQCLLLLMRIEAILHRLLLLSLMFLLGTTRSLVMSPPDVVLHYYYVSCGYVRCRITPILALCHVPATSFCEEAFEDVEIVG